MATQTTAVIDAMRELADLRRESGQDDGSMYALAWMVGARLVKDKRLPNGGQVFNLTERETWEAARTGVGALCAGIIWGDTSALSHEPDRIVGKAARITARLLEIEPDFHFSVPDALWYLSAPRAADLHVVSPEVCDLLFSVLDAPSGADVWIPFDPVGQLASRAARLDLKFRLLGPLAWPTDAQRLCRAVLGIFEDSLDQTVDVERNSAGKREFEADYLLALPPIGARIQPGMGWHQWESDDPKLARNRMLVYKLGPALQLRLDRADSWTPAALWPRVRKRAVFMTAQSLLFARGQEQRLREAWVMDHYPIDLVLSLPTRMYSHTSIAPAILAFDRLASGYKVRMGDLSEFTDRTEQSGRAGKKLDLKRALRSLGLNPVLGEAGVRSVVDPATFGLEAHTPGEGKVITVNHEKLLAAECNLQPSRYLQPTLASSGHRMPLRELVDVIRAPVATTDPYSDPAVEIGITDLGSWRPIEPIAPAPDVGVKEVSVRKQRLVESALRRGDLILSTKGTKDTVGRSAIIEKTEVTSEDDSAGSRAWPLVCSTNCVALRPRDQRVPSQYLLLYFRSGEFRLQLNALLVGSVIPHVTPNALCDSVQIPIPTSRDLAQMLEKYQLLCKLEAQVEAANLQIAEIVRELWQPEL